MVVTSPNGRLNIRVNLKGKVWSREIEIWEMSVYRKTIHNLSLDDTTWGWSGALGCSSIYGFRRGDNSPERSQRKRGHGRRRETKRGWCSGSQGLRPEGEISFDNGC